MNPDLEALLLAYDAVIEAKRTPDKERTRVLFENFNCLLGAIAERQAISERALRDAVHRKHAIWSKRQIHPPTLPPKA